MSPMEQTRPAKPYEACPGCGSASRVREKLLPIDAFNAGNFLDNPNERSGCACHGDLSVDGLRPEYVEDGPLQQFVLGLYCDACGKGFVPEYMAKPAPQLWKLSKEGWHRVETDGSLGPPQERIG
jgi:hypothetical protein